MIVGDGNGLGYFLENMESRSGNGSSSAVLGYFLGSNACMLCIPADIVTSNLMSLGFVAWFVDETPLVPPFTPVPPFAPPWNMLLLLLFCVWLVPVNVKSKAVSLLMTFGSCFL